MNLQDWLSKLNPAEISFSFAFFLSWIVLIWWLVFQYWPWWKKDFQPAKMRRVEEKDRAQLQIERDQTTALNRVGDAMVQMNVLVGQQMTLLQQHEQHVEGHVAKILSAVASAKAD